MSYQAGFGKRNRPVDTLFKGDKRLGALNPGHLLNFVVKHLPEVKRIAAHDLGENAVDTSSIMNIHDLGDFHQLFGYFFVE
jgi:hypothetical protein